MPIIIFYYYYYCCSDGSDGSDGGNVHDESSAECVWGIFGTLACRGPGINITWQPLSACLPVHGSASEHDKST